VSARAQPDAPYLTAPETGTTMTYARLQRDSRDLGRYHSRLLTI